MRLSALFLLCFTLLTASGQIIPKPLQTIQLGSTFTIDNTARLYTDTPLAKNAIAYLQTHLQRVSGYTLPQTETATKTKLRFHYAPKVLTKAEGYRLKVSEHGILIQARDSNGFFYAVITLMQLMPKEIWGDGHVKKSRWDIGGVEIIDAPRYH